MPSPQDIRKLHRTLQASLNSLGLLATGVIIRPISDEDWDNPEFRGTATFDVWSPSAPEFGLSDHGRREPVVSLSPRGGKRLEIEPVQRGPRPWVSWFEGWRRPGDGGFELVIAKWTVFWGTEGDDRKPQVLRAEWNAASASDGDPNNAGQPHWHVDPPLLTAAEPITTELEEVPPQRREEWLSASGVHLAMGGWRNACPVANLWWVDLGQDTEALRQWAVEALRYLSNECRHLKECTAQPQP